jgi:hypothetical protein
MQAKATAQKEAAAMLEEQCRSGDILSCAGDSFQPHAVA